MIIISPASAPPSLLLPVVISTRPVERRDSTSMAATVEPLPLGVQTSGLPPDQEPVVLAAPIVTS
ncbi:MAG: hypothetical protein KKB30_06160 [Proteobacteria bacterium]|nr:hypothetical protein [Pseudomonadota bacterium]MBU1715104.1 hypothetical protein [Pseudomonadota bacterium]